jgi:hypothetical protein
MVVESLLGLEGNLGLPLRGRPESVVGVRPVLVVHGGRGLPLGPRSGRPWRAGGGPRKVGGRS